MSIRKPPCLSSLHREAHAEQLDAIKEANWRREAPQTQLARWQVVRQVAVDSGNARTD